MTITMEATTAGQFYQLWTKIICSSHPRPLLHSGFGSNLNQFSSKLKCIFFFKIVSYGQIRASRGISLIYGNCFRLGIYLCITRYKFMHMNIFIYMHIFMHMHIFTHMHIFMLLYMKLV